MTYRSKIAALACVGIVSIGMVGCGDGNDPEALGMDPEQAAMYLGAAIELSSLVDPIGDPIMDPDGAEGQSNLFIGTQNILESFDISQNLGPRMPGMDETVTLQCLFGGTMTITTKLTDGEVDGIYSHSADYNVTFDNCVDSDPMLGDVLMDALEPPIGAVQYAHNGSLSATFSESGTEPRETISESRDMVLNADNFTLEYIQDGEVRDRLSADFAASIGGVQRDEIDNEAKVLSGDLESITASIDLSVNGEIVWDSLGLGPDGEGTMQWKLEGREFEARMSGTEEMAPIQPVDGESYLFTADGYLGTSFAVDGEVVDVGYLETDDFEARWAREGMDIWISGPGQTTYESYNGLFGTSCMDGTVTFNTTDEWVTNSEQPDIYDQDGTTPGEGTTTMTGSDGTATVNWDTNGSGNAYGTVTAGGETSEPMTRQEILSIPGLCNIFVGPWGR